MSLHLKKLCVGIDSLAGFRAHLQQLQDQGHQQYSHVTRQWPKQSSTLLESGHLYWIIKGAYACRQRILRLEQTHIQEKPACRIVLKIELQPLDPWPHRPFQGWRYLKASEAPSPIEIEEDSSKIPSKLRLELKELGLLRI